MIFFFLVAVQLSLKVPITNSPSHQLCVSKTPYLIPFSILGISNSPDVTLVFIVSLYLNCPRQCG